MSAKEAILTSSRLVVVIGLVALGGCEKPPAQPIVEQPPAPQVSEAVSPPQTTEMPALPAPKVERVQEAVKRIFKDAVMIDSSRKPSFLVGDFNGDLSQDLAVVLKPAEGKISELNQEFPSWIAREPLNEILLPKSKILAQPVAANPSTNPAAGQIIRFHQGDVLLAIIHGYGPKGWQDPEATQTHLLRDVVGPNMAILPLKEAVKIYKRVKPFPNIYGDLIQQTLIGQSGFLHFAGGMYAWYDPKNYKPAPVPAHSGMSGMR